MQRGGVRDLLLDHVPLEFGGSKLQPLAADQRSALDGIAAGLPQGKQLMVKAEVGKVKPRHPADRVQCEVERHPQLLRQGRELAGRRHPVKTADPHVDRVNGPAAQQLHDRISDPPERQAALHDLPVITREFDGTRVAEEVGRVQHVDVQRVAGDPLAAVQQPPQVR